MKKSSNITSVETITGFQEKMVEKFVKNNLPLKAHKENKIYVMGGFSVRYKEIECCVAEIPVNGTAEIFYSLKNPDTARRFSYPVTSRFIVFFVRDANKDYKVAWSCSLS